MTLALRHFSGSRNKNSTLILPCWGRTPLGSTQLAKLSVAHVQEKKSFPTDPTEKQAVNKKAEAKRHEQKKRLEKRARKEGGDSILASPTLII